MTARTMNGIEAFLEVLAASGVTRIFGNPGTTELPLNHVLASDERFRYIFGIHEIPVVAMANGYALATGHVGVANVHIACGLGNSMGMLYNAYCEGTPLLLTAGQQDRRLRFEEPVLEGDLVGVARPWTKWAVEVQRVEDIPSAVRRAIQTALTPPTGPVFLALPVDLQMEPVAGLDLSPAYVPDHRVRPSVAALQQAVAVLAEAERPAILAGSRVTEAHAIGELTAVAELLGAPVFAECATSHGREPIAEDHPLARGPLPLWAPEVHERLKEFDVLLVVGINLLREYIHHEQPRAVPGHLRLIQMDHNPWELGKNYPVEVGILGDPKCGLDELAQMLTTQLSAEQNRAAQTRREAWANQRAAEQEGLRAKIREQGDVRPMTPLAMIGALARVLPADVVLVEEATTSHNHVLGRLGVLKDPRAHFAQRGWALGWGLGTALGVRLAWPDRPVVSLLGDGAALYGIQGLWSAAHENIPVTFIICNNAQYQILKVSGKKMSLPNLLESNAPGMELTNPEIDFVALARSFGVQAVRVETPDELSDCVVQSLASDQPLVIDVPLRETR